MNKELHKQDVINKISDKLVNEKIVIGGNGEKYKRRYHLPYTQKIIKKVIESFWEVVAEVIEDGDSIQIYRYIKIEPKYFKEMSSKSANWLGNKDIYIPARYKMKFTMGERLKEACRILTEKELNNGGNKY